LLLIHLHFAQSSIQLGTQRQLTVHLFSLNCDLIQSLMLKIHHASHVDLYDPSLLILRQLFGIFHVLE